MKNSWFLTCGIYEIPGQDLLEFVAVYTLAGLSAQIPPPLPKGEDYVPRRSLAKAGREWLPLNSVN